MRRFAVIQLKQSILTTILTGRFIAVLRRSVPTENCCQATTASPEENVGRPAQASLRGGCRTGACGLPKAMSRKCCGFERLGEQRDVIAPVGKLLQRRCETRIGLEQRQRCNPGKQQAAAGGTAAGTARARDQGWRAMIEFLSTSLG